MENGSCSQEKHGVTWENPSFLLVGVNGHPSKSKGAGNHHEKQDSYPAQHVTSAPNQRQLMMSADECQNSFPKCEEADHLHNPADPVNNSDAHLRAKHMHCVCSARKCISGAPPKRSICIQAIVVAFYCNGEDPAGEAASFSPRHIRVRVRLSVQRFWRLRGTHRSQDGLQSSAAAKPNIMGLDS